MAVVGEISSDADLVKLATALNTTRTPHAKKAPPSIALVLFAKLDEASAAAALEALAKVKGVDSKGSTADVKEGQLSIKLQGIDASGGATLKVADLLQALKKAGIEASFSKT